MKNRILITLTMLVCLSLTQIVAQGIDIVPKQSKGKWGYVNNKGKKVISFKYTSAAHFNKEEGLAIVGKIAGKNDRSYGCIDITGKEVIPCKYESISYLSEGLLSVTIKSKTCIIDKTSKEVIPCKYDKINIFSAEINGLARVQLDKKSGFVDKAGKEVIPCKYDKIDKFSAEINELARVQLDKKSGFVDKTGKEVIPCKYDEIRGFVQGLAPAALGSKWCFIDKTGNEVTPCKYDNFITGFTNDGLKNVESDSKWGCIDSTGIEVIPCKYDKIDQFSAELNGLAKVQLEKKWGYIDKIGNEVIPCKYDLFNRFSAEINELAKVQSDSKWGFVDKTGKEVIHCKYDLIGKFYKLPTSEVETAGVLADGKSGRIDKNSKETIRPRYQGKEMQAIWENILLPNEKLKNYIIDIGQIRSKYASRYNRTDSFTIKRPYVSVHTISGSEHDITFRKYSENSFSVKNVKTLVVEYLVEHTSGEYVDPYRNSSRTTITSYSSYLYYFDVETKEYIGYDYLRGPNLPSSVTGYANIYISPDLIIKTIVSRLTTSVE